MGDSDALGAYSAVGVRTDSAYTCIHVLSEPLQCTVQWIIHHKLHYMKTEKGCPREQIGNSKEGGRCACACVCAPV